MKRSIALLAIAAAVLFLAATSMPVAVAESGDRIIVPNSSIVHPEDAGVRAHTNIRIVVPAHVEIGSNGAPIGENPLALSCIYDLVKQTKGCPKTSNVLPTGGSKAIALVDAYNNPDATTDIKTFATAYGYPTPNFTVVKVGSPANDSGWALEESLDIEYAFGMAPGAQIYLVEANSNSFTDLLAAEDKATALVQAAGGGEVSNSWGGGDFSGENQYDSHFKGKGVVYFASSGDSGGQVIYPSASPFVVSAGGTLINRDGNGNFTYESAAYFAGGGPSQYEKRPSYQNVIKKIVGTHRGTPDIAALAIGAVIYSQYGCGGWCSVDGTSISSPAEAGILNAANSFKASTNAELTLAYKDYGNAKTYKADWNDITHGSNGYTCKKGWEYCTGIGSPHTFKGK